MGSSWAHGLQPHAATQPPLGLEAFFQGFSNIVFTFGGHCMLMELVDSQFRPSKFSRTFAFSLIYVTATLTLPNAAFTFLAFPDKVRARGTGARRARTRAHTRTHTHTRAHTHTHTHTRTHTHTHTHFAPPGRALRQRVCHLPPVRLEDGRHRAHGGAPAGGFWLVHAAGAPLSARLPACVQGASQAAWMVQLLDMQQACAWK